MKNIPVNSLALQWLGLSVLTAEAWALSLVRELRSHKQQHGQKKKKKKNSNLGRRIENETSKAKNGSIYYIETF